jgi:four helix bundle protein
MKDFRSYQLAVSFYRQCRSYNLPHYLKIQLLRAASSIALNLAEGSAKKSLADRRRFYRIAFASLRECQAILQLEPNQTLSLSADTLAAHTYRLIKSLEL